MYLFTVNIIFCPTIRALNKSLVCSHSVRYFNKKIDTTSKRGSMLLDMIANKDKRKNWHLEIIPTKAKVRTFEKIHKPHRRRAVLNSLFISNITDVISTGDILPEIRKHGLEITGVQISPCMKILNVFWQVPVSQYDFCDDIGQILAAAAPRIRAELISRNVLGRVPMIFFLRDATNARVSAFEEAMKKLELEPKTDLGLIINDDFIEDLYSFKNSKATEKRNELVEEKKQQEISEEKNIAAEEEENIVAEEENIAAEEKRKISEMPYKPVGMKCDVFGLDHELLMEKVIAVKKKNKSLPEKTAIISPESLNDADDLFSKIPGVCFQVHSSQADAASRDAILKKFHIERKMLRERKKDNTNDNFQLHYDDDEDEELDNNKECDLFNDDFVEDESTNTVHK